MGNAKTNKTVLITGCSAGGIGDALAQAFHRRGCRVFATARNPSKAQHLKDMGIEVYQMDVLDAASCKNATEMVKKETSGTLDILVNNSGLGYTMPLIDADITEVKKVFDTNVVGIILSVQAFAPLLIKAKGTIINIGSVTGIIPLPWGSIYNSSKAAVNQLTDTLRLEMKPLGVNVILAVSGIVRTNFLQNLVGGRLPETSVYYPAKTVIEPVMSGQGMEERAMDKNKYANDFVHNALKSTPTVRYWSGADSGLVWLVHTFLWATVWDTLLHGTSGMATVKKLLNKGS